MEKEREGERERERERGRERERESTQERRGDTCGDSSCLIASSTAELKPTTTQANKTQTLS